MKNWNIYTCICCGLQWAEIASSPVDPGCAHCGSSIRKIGTMQGGDEIPRLMGRSPTDDQPSI